MTYSPSEEHYERMPFNRGGRSGIKLPCYHLTRAMGYDTENLRRLNKVTRTW